MARTKASADVSLRCNGRPRRGKKPKEGQVAARSRKGSSVNRTHLRSKASKPSSAESVPALHAAHAARVGSRRRRVAADPGRATAGRQRSRGDAGSPAGEGSSSRGRSRRGEAPVVLLQGRPVGVETRRTPGSAAGCNKPAAVQRNKPSRWCETTRADRVVGLVALPPKIGASRSGPRTLHGMSTEGRCETNLKGGGWNPRESAKEGRVGASRSEGEAKDHDGRDPEQRCSGPRRVAEAVRTRARARRSRRRAVKATEPLRDSPGRDKRRSNFVRRTLTAVNTEPTPREPPVADRKVHAGIGPDPKPPKGRPADVVRSCQPIFC
jgi:hypothetical protein